MPLCDLFPASKAFEFRLGLLWLSCHFVDLLAALLLLTFKRAFAGLRVLLELVVPDLIFFLTLHP